MTRLSKKTENYTKRFGKIMKKYSKKIVQFSKKSYDLIFKKASAILKKIVKMESKKKSTHKKKKNTPKYLQKGGLAGEIVGAVSSVAHGIGSKLVSTMCPYNSGGTGGDIGTLAKDLVGVVSKTGCSAGHGLLTTDALLSLPGNLGTAYRETGAPGADL
jgi:hypothetical protein